MDNNIEKITRLKSQLSSLLESEITDHDKILYLSHELASLEKNKVRFSIDAGVIDRLGQELVARQETAVSELVKNAYDADATKTKLTFINTDSIGGDLIIEDDGVGMDRDDLVNGFMRISSTFKVHHPISAKFKRQRAGQKGIGRFSVQRLGNSLTIITQVKENNYALKLDINWNDYIGDTNLLTISNNLEIVKKERESGTTLYIGDLRDKWTPASIQRVYRYVSNIIQPFSLSEIHQQKDLVPNIDPGFSALFYKEQNGNKIKIADKSVMVYEHAVAEIEGYIDENGIGIYTVDSKKLGINEIGEIGNSSDDNTVPFSELRKVRFKAFYYIYDSDLIPKMHATSIRKLAQSEGGIRLYRNGFRVLPYAESGDDWLGLDRSVRRRSILPQHGNINFFGFVELQDTENKYNETSSREGLIENDAFIQLKNFIYRTLMTGIMLVARSRNIKIVSGQQKDERGYWEEIEIRIKNIAHTIDELDKTLEIDSNNIEVKRKRKKRVNKIKKAIEDLKKTQQTEVKKTIKERSMLRVLSSVGLTVSQFVHEIKHYMDNIRGDINFLINRLQNDISALERAEILRNNFELFHDYTAYFNDVVSQNIIKDLQPQNMRYVVNRFINSMSADAHKVNISFVEPRFNKNWLYTKPMHPSEWSSILFNFYTNSKKAIQRAHSNGKILIECGEENELIYLEFSDNGDGIKQGAEEAIFDEFYTTTTMEYLDQLDENKEILGTGLGLKITKDIVKGYRGNIYVTSPKEDYSTCIRIEIAKANDKELDEYGI